MSTSNEKLFTILFVGGIFVFMPTLVIGSAVLIRIFGS